MHAFSSFSLFCKDGCRALAALLALVFAFGSGQTLAEPLAGYESHTPAVAYDAANGRGLVVYEHYGRIYGVFVDGQGRALGGSFLVLPTTPAARGRYADPAIVFKTPQNRYYIAARQSYTTTLNLPGGPASFDTADGIGVVSLDVAGTAIVQATLYTPGFLRNPLVTDAEAKPAIAADTYNDPSCCIAVAWQDARDPRVFLTRQLGIDLNPYDPSVRRIDTLSESTANVSASYDQRRDRFAFAYDACAAVGRLCAAAVRSVQAVTGGQGPALTLPMRGDGVPTTPSIAHVISGDRYVLAAAWRDSARLPRVSAVSAHVLTPGAGGALSVAGSIEQVDYAPCPGCGTIAISRPHVAPIGDYGRVMIAAPSIDRATGQQQFVGYTLEVAPVRLLNGFSAFSPPWSYIPNGRTVYAPNTNRMIGIWEQQRLDGGVWSAAFLQ